MDTIIITNIASFLFGVTIGIFIPNENVKILGGYFKNVNLRVYIGVIVSIIWVASYIFSFATGNPVDGYINTIFGGIVTATFTEETIKNMKKK